MKKLSTILCSLLCTVPAFAGTWSLAGSGTQADPYKINSAADFRTLAAETTEKNTGEGEYFLLTCDVNFGGTAASPQQLPSIGRDGVTMVANVQWGFEGSFDGGGHTITGIYHTENQNNKAGQFNGIFSHIGPKGSVKNLIIGKENYINSYNYVAPIVSLCQGTISNCINYADINATNAFAGGICGHLLLGTGYIADCENHGNINAMTYSCGILGGCQGNPQWEMSKYQYIVENCKNYGKMTSTNDTGNSGISGSFSGTVRNCVNYGEIDGWANHYNYGQYSGGIISCASYPVAIEDCTNYATVIGQKNSGGIVGNIMKGLGDKFTIANCTNFGDVKGEGANIGGIIGYTLRAQDVISVANCINLGNVSTTAETDQIGNIRGSSLIALGEGNLIASGLQLYALDEGIETYDPNANAWGLAGSGTQSDPYQITTADDFYSLASNISEDNNGKGEYFLMMNDIDFNGSESAPALLPAIGKAGITNIANVAWGFEGSFDGGNHTVSGIYHNAASNDRNGQFNAIFSSLGENGSIANLVFDESNVVNSYNYTAAFASISKGSITNCTNNSDIKAENAFAGGICGYVISGKGVITSCINRGAISAMTYAAGIVGGSQSGAAVSSYDEYIVEDCSNYGTISTTNGIGSAGIAGSYSGVITGCDNYGAIADPSTANAQYSAGIVSCTSYPVEISYCTNYGEVSGGKNMGGIIGMVMKGNDGEFTVRDCTNKGTISASGENVAGIIGNTQRSNGQVIVAGCHNEGEVSSSAVIAESTMTVGNIRGSELIALGKDNTISEGLTHYLLDGDTRITGLVSLPNESSDRLKDGKYFIDGKIVIVRNGVRYTLDGRII